MDWGLLIQQVLKMLKDMKTEQQTTDIDLKKRRMKIGVFITTGILQLV